MEMQPKLNKQNQRAMTIEEKEKMISLAKSYRKQYGIAMIFWFCIFLFFLSLFILSKWNTNGLWIMILLLCFSLYSKSKMHRWSQYIESLEDYVIYVEEGRVVSTSTLRRRSITKTYYASIDFPDVIGEDEYGFVCNMSQRGGNVFISKKDYARIETDDCIVVCCLKSKSHPDIYFGILKE